MDRFDLSTGYHFLSSIRIHLNCIKKERITNKQHHKFVTSLLQMHVQCHLCKRRLSLMLW